MALDRRVTLRCLTEDLTHDWDEIDQRRGIVQLNEAVRRLVAGTARDSEVRQFLEPLPRLNMLAHPLIRNFDANFQDDADPSRRAVIKGTSNPHFWKVKTNRWRGAATDHSLAGADQVWLCAGGLRADGDGRDFYESKASDLAHYSAMYLPTEHDRELARVDQKVTQFDAWKLQVTCATLLLFAEAEHTDASIGPMTILDARGDRAIAELTVATETITEDNDSLTEVRLEVRTCDRAAASAVQLVSEIARAALNDAADAWTLLPVDEDMTAYCALPTTEASARADLLLEHGTLLESDVPDRLRLGIRAHYAPRERLVEAQVAGLAVLALCGYWFVPTSDHEHVPTCEDCRAARERLPQ